MDGYVESVSASDLAELAHRHDLVIVEDLGSGALIDLSRFGIDREPLPQESLRQGVDVVTFSGDKLLCGPQAGIIVGTSRVVDGMKKNPLARALRMDKMTLAALEETLRSYLEPDTLVETVPTLGMIACVPEDLKRRADAVCKALTAELGGAMKASVGEATSQIGGGSLPAAGLKTCILTLTSEGHSADEIVSILRGCEIPIIARIFDDNVVIDFRTVQPSEDEILTRQIVAAFAGGDTE
jgi:L-seryl-tRNA(Ser) seleniumtransferase